MNMFDEARSIDTIIKMCNLSQSDMAKRMGVSQSYIANKQRLLKLSNRVQKSIIDNRLSERHARSLLRLESEEKQLEMIEKAAIMHLSAVALESLIDGAVLISKSKKIGSRSAYEAIELFEEILGEGIMGLKSVGVNATKSVNYDKNKKYITLCLYI